MTSLAEEDGEEVQWSVESLGIDDPKRATSAAENQPQRLCVRSWNPTPESFRF